MQCTPKSSNALFKSAKDDCFDSGYSGLFYTPQSITRDDSVSLVVSDKTPKENLEPSATPKDRMGFLGKETRAAPWPTTVGWCETPKLHKSDASVRHKSAVCKYILDTKAHGPRSPNTKSSLSLGSGQWLSTSLDSLDTVMDDLDTDLPSSSRKRRFHYSQVRTSTLDDSKLNPEQLSSFGGRVSLSDADFKESCSPSDKLSPETQQTSTFPVLLKTNPQSPMYRNSLCDSSELCTPSGLQTHKHTRSLREDSGFSSLALDKSQDSSDHDGSFQELLLSASRRNDGTPNLLDTIRRPRLQRQKRLSTLKEGGSQSEDDLVDKNKHQSQNHQKEDDVFAVAATPHNVRSLKMVNAMSSDSVTSTKQDYVTPLRMTSTKPESKTPCSSSSINSGATPLGNTPLNLSLTPALELVHAMCQQKAQTFKGQSPSLKEELKYTAALVQTPVKIRTTMPLAGLIGRKMGMGTVDILKELNKRNLKHILSIILGHLTPECIYSCGQVCRSWKVIIQQDRRASFRRRSHLKELSDSLEQGGVAHVPDGDTRMGLVKRSALQMVQSRSSPQSGSRTVTPLQNSTLLPGSGSKGDKFLEVAKTLFSDEWLKACPRCEHPARCHSVKGKGVCSREDCGFQFCTSCLCAFHGSRECGSQSGNRRKKDILIPGSAQSKRNVRRL